MKKIDILMATYNGENYIAQQIDSILNQSYGNFNLIISDDSSIDNTFEILKEYQSKDKRIKVFKQDKNLGVVSNFEFLLNRVENEFFMLADQDDIWEKDKIEKTLKKINDENADLVYTDLKVVDENLNVISNSYWKLKGFTKKIFKYNNCESLYLNNYITGCTVICKSKWIKRILPLPKTSKYVIHDYWLALIVSIGGKISYINEPLIKYRQHKQNSIGSKRKSDEIRCFDELRNLFITVKKEHFKVFIDNNDKFGEKYRELNEKSLKYFEMLETKKYINLRQWNLFFELYKYENLIYSLENFIILNVPILGRILFNLKGIKNGK